MPLSVNYVEIDAQRLDTVCDATNLKTNEKIEFKAIVEYMLNSIDCCIGRKAQQESKLKYSKPTVIH